MPIDLNWLKRQFPHLENLENLSIGGQKYVFSASDPTRGDVVVKLIHPAQDPEMVRREILAVQQVRSPRVPTILDHGQIRTEFGAFIWILEQRILGRSLRQCLATGRLEPQDLLRMALHVLEALAQAETAQIVHRDVKPENIMRDNDGSYWLLDFGIARHLQLSSLTPTAAPFGKFTLGYASPEQCRNIKPDIDSRADLFALGVTMFECGTGVNPFLTPPASQIEILGRVENLPLPLLVLGIKQPEPLRDLVSSMTQKRRDLRLRTAQEAFAWLREICELEQV